MLTIVTVEKTSVQFFFNKKKKSVCQWAFLECLGITETLSVFNASSTELLKKNHNIIFTDVFFYAMIEVFQEFI